jgi:hypothetical protein
MKTTYIGTVRRNKAELPSIAKKKNQALHSSLFFENDGGVVLTVYQGTKDKNVLLMSSHHDRVYIDTQRENRPEKKKPNIIIDYNKTKFGVDALDQMTKQYNVKMPTRRWPVQVFYNILNLAAINAYVLYKRINAVNISRRKFLIKIIEEIQEMVTVDDETRTAARSTLIPLLRKKLNVSNEQTPPTDARKRIFFYDHENRAITIDDYKVSCQIRINCTHNKATAICEGCRLSCCGKCIVEEKIRAKCKRL